MCYFIYIDDECDGTGIRECVCLCEAVKREGEQLKMGYFIYDCNAIEWCFGYTLYVLRILMAIWVSGHGPHGNVFTLLSGGWCTVLLANKQI